MASVGQVVLVHQGEQDVPAIVTAVGEDENGKQIADVAVLTTTYSGLPVYGSVEDLEADIIHPHTGKSDPSIKASVAVIDGAAAAKPTKATKAAADKE